MSAHAQISVLIILVYIFTCKFAFFLNLRCKVLKKSYLTIKEMTKSIQSLL